MAETLRHADMCRALRRTARRQAKALGHLETAIGNIERLLGEERGKPEPDEHHLHALEESLEEFEAELRVTRHTLDELLAYIRKVCEP
ncbi:hypothetical protein [Streptomyces megasporus]|uniref:hypothetical protein n=1 Tax=Streptomyces megasporus TaxID=44060 RepID=UPI0004E1B9C7|nr:hypothetical protein [Streptomyces megasporus]